MRMLLLCVLTCAVVIFLVCSRPLVPPPVVSTPWRARNLAHHVRRCTVTRREEAREPVVLRSLAAMATVFERTHDWMAALHMADTYARGSYPLFAPNPAVAASLYRFVKDQCTEPDIASLSRAKLVDVFRNPIGADDVEGHELPVQYATRVLQTYVPRRVPPPARPTPPVPPVQTPMLPVTPPQAPPRVYSDAQNVHDHGVVASLRANIRTLQTEVDIDDSDVRPSIQEAINAVADLTPEQRAHAELVLNRLGTQVLGSVGVSEQEAAALVWAKVQAMDDADTRSNCIETLAKQLASGVEHGSVVCSTGKVARLLGTLDGIGDIGDHSAVKPLWAVQQELMALASSRRDRGDSADQFTQEALDVYVHGLGMAHETLMPLIEECASAF